MSDECKSCERRGFWAGLILGFDSLVFFDRYPWWHRRFLCPAHKELA